MKAIHSSRRVLTALLLTAILVLSLAACGNSNTASTTQAAQTENKTDATEAAEASQTHLIGYSLNSMDSTMKTMADYFESVAREHGWEPVLLNANGDVATELNNMESLMNMGCEAVVIMGCDTAGSADTLKDGTDVITALVVDWRYS